MEPKEPQPSPTKYSAEIRAMLVSHTQELISAQVQSTYNQYVERVIHNAEIGGDPLEKTHNPQRLEALHSEAYFALKKIEPWPQFPDRPFGVVLIKVNPENGKELPVSNVPVTHVDKQGNEVRDVEPPYPEMGGAFSSPFSPKQVDIMLNQLKQQEAADWAPVDSV